jgi:Ricin-type beta-trefoil lectin domain-like
MANSYWFFDVAGLVVDVTGGNPTPGTPLQGWSLNSPFTNNQLWTFEPGPSGGFFIKSNLGDNLVIDVKGGNSAPGTPLQVWPQNTPPTNNQLWRFAPYFPFAQGSFHSLLGYNLVIDARGGSSARGTPLQIWPQNTPFTYNQLWNIAPVSGNSYDPRITAIVPAIIYPGFTVAGEGFQAGSQVLGNYIFSDPNTGLASSGSFATGCDLGGGFSSSNPIDTLYETNTGTLVVQVSFSLPSFSNAVAANWNGNSFTM